MKSIRIFFLSVVLLCSLWVVKGEPLYPYYVPREFGLPKMNSNDEPFWRSKAVHVGFGLLGAGAVVAFVDRDIRSMRNDFISSFHYRYDDYMQFSPAVIMLAMKSLGVESRSSWPRMLSADAFSTAIMMGYVYGIKYGIGRLRPDGSSYNSFPSGHTAMAFMAATMFHNEYGHLSPWISLAGYSLATATGISRALNNRHWFSDVVVGAGIGILSTKLGYYITDAIFSGTKFGAPPDEQYSSTILDRPSFVSLSLGCNLSTLGFSESSQASRSGIALGVEGALFLTPHLGVGGEFGIDRFAARIGAADGTVDNNELINSISMLLGGYANHNLAAKWQLGGKVVAGVLRNVATERPIAGSNSVAAFDDQWRFSAAMGLSVRHIVSRNFGLRLFADITLVPTGYTVDSRPTTVRYALPVTLGVAVDALLW
ncbi:MAG: phosphatase PAP2 family protein [Tidjanibacter sp.]|nr:phosphatase PAP2 family protein [Tidjanibacter sp.]